MGVIVKPKNLKDRQVKRLDRIAESNPDRARTVANRISDRRNERGAENPQLAKDIAARRSMAKPVMKMGGKSSLKPVDSSKKPGLAKLPTEVRNKMGYQKNGGKTPKPKMAKGGMLKRADGSYSKRGLWDNIRANRGSGKKPTAQMLKQEKKIKAKSK